MAIPTPNCPCSVWNGRVCENLSECTAGMHYGDICQASTTLPDGNSNYDVWNCGSVYGTLYNVFKCEEGKKSIIFTHPYYHLSIYPHIKDTYIDIILAR